MPTPPGALLFTGLGFGSPAVAVGATFEGAAWTSLVNVGPIHSGHYPGVSGIAELPGGRGLAVNQMELSHTLESAPWSAGAWGTFGAAQGTMIGALGAPEGTATGAVVAYATEDLITSPVKLATYRASDDTWSLDEATGLSNSGDGPPQVAVTAAGDPLVVAYTRDTSTFQWSLRTGTTWSAPAPVPGVRLAYDSTVRQPAFPVMARRVGTDQIVAVFPTNPTADTRATYMAATTFTGGAWSAAPVVVAGPVSGVVNLAVAPLFDGWVALACTAPDGTVQVGFFDGTAWGAFRHVSATYPAGWVALTAGVDSTALLELIYQDVLNEQPVHLRLTDESAWTWSTPVPIDPHETYAYDSPRIARISLGM